MAQVLIGRQMQGGLTRKQHKIMIHAVKTARDDREKENDATQVSDQDLRRINTAAKT
jgi:hypothetical protein